MGLSIRNNNDGTQDILDNLSRVIVTYDPNNRSFKIGGTLDVTAVGALITLAAGSIPTAALAAQVVTAPKLTTTLATGTIPLALGNWRKVVSNDVPNIAAAGGTLAKDTDPIFERVNGATDKALRIKWAAGSVIEVFYDGPIEVPIDLDASQPLVMCVEALMSGSTDTPILTLGYWPGIGGANGGGNTGALSNARQKVSRNIAAPGTYPIAASLTMFPGTHATDAVHVMSTFIEYTRK